MYQKHNKVLVPRHVSDLHADDAHPPAELTDKEGRGSHWVGWVMVHDPDKEELDWFGVWQDYKKRGFLVQQDSNQEVTLVHGEDYNNVLNHIEKLWRKEKL